MVPTRRKFYLLMALLLCSGIASAQVVVKGNVYGGGQGIRSDETTGLVTGNTWVTVNGGTVQNSIYGGGEFGSVGTFTAYETVTYNAGQENQMNVLVPKTCASGTGVAKIILNGGQVGILDHALMPTPGTTTWDDANGYIFAGSRGEADSITYPLAIAIAVVDSTYLEVNNDMVIAASIYGGSENGLVLRNTHVKVNGGQIGVGYYKDNTGGDHIVPAYTAQQWANAIAKVKDGTFVDADAAGFYPCHAWPYGKLNPETQLKDYLVYDPFAHPDSAYYAQALEQGASLYASDGSTFLGNVFGGGSGYYPIAPGIWRRTAGQVKGNTQVDITGGHILSAVFGGNELTDVLQKVTINMTGGTVGIPCAFDSIVANPMGGHIFGSGKGDMRTLFNRWTNADSAEVNINGGVVFGSVYGSGEDGHVLNNVVLNISENNADTRPVIGTFGTTTFDGNVFGSGRGFLGNAYTAGSVGGNVLMNITGGQVLGDVYGGGRLASVGSYFVDPQMEDPENPGTMIDNPDYGQLQEGEDHGYVTININGVTIGNDRGTTVGGNVFGGSMGRVTDLNNQINSMWLDLAKVKQTTVNIGNGDATTTIKGNVHGGGEIGTVTQNTTVNLTPNSTTQGTVYGGGKGYSATHAEINSNEEYNNTVKAGQVYGNTLVNMTGGMVESSIYGGGELGSVGTFETYYDETTATGVHFVGEPKTCAENTGLAKVVISGGQAGLVDHATMPTPGTGTWADDNGFVFCGSRGEADTITYPNAHLQAIVDTTYLEIRDDALVTASVYGGSENGMVIRDTHVKIMGGQIGVGYDPTTLQFYSAYTTEQWNTAIEAIGNGELTEAIANQFYDCDAWAYGNGIDPQTGYPIGPFLVYDPFADPEENPEYTSQALEEGAALVATDGNSFFGKVYGGGSGYYPIAPGVWRRSAGRVNGNTLVDIEGGHILTAVYGGNETTDVLSKSTVNMSGGTVGVPGTFTDIVATPTTGHVFGAGLGDTRTRFNRWCNVNETEVNITGGTVFGSVFGGGADGHVLDDSKVTVDGENALIGTYGHTLFDGNVFGGGRGFSGNALTAGAVCGNTEVNIVNGQVLGSVYGGGRLASVGLDLLDPEDENYGVLQDGTNHGYTTVNINGGIIGAVGNYEDNVAIGDHRVSGNVYGGSKGRLTQMDYTTMNPLWPSLGKVKQTEVYINGSDVVIKGDVFGGGEIGTVLDSTNVFVSNGTLMRDLFGGGYGSTSTATIENSDTIPVMIAGRVFGRTNATVGGGLVKHNVYGGGEYAKVGIDVNEVTTIRQSTVSLNGGIIGSHNNEGELFGGMVYGGGMGILADTTVAMVLGNTYIYDTLSDNNTPAHVLGHIHGGGEKALVQQHTYLTLGSVEVGTLADATETVTKTLPDNSSVTLYQTRMLEGGRVFGGGQGVEDVNYRNAALVMGNTNTEVTGTAKVYGSVYGGGELANVGSGTLDNDINTGSATVTISGGTIGPLNGSQRNGNVFGGGKGPEELSSDTYYAMVDSTHVIIKGGASIAGSVFGGGANGRVLGNASTDIQGGTIGTTGLTTWDGNVFGAGRNYNAYANTTGAVFGNVDIQMSDGTVKGNMYGGGRFGSVGMDYNTDHTSIDTLTGPDHGYVNINITGGTIGDEYVQYLGHYSNGSDVPRTGFVFGGGRGIMDTDKIDKLGNVKGTTVTVGGDALVKSSVYGGSERGIIYKNTLVRMTDNAQVGENLETMANHRGDVYGGGCGYDSIASGSTYVFSPLAGSVKGNTRVEMDGSKVYGNIFGAGRLTDVLGHASVIISGGEVGWERTLAQINDKPDFGYVYAAGRGEPQERFKTWTTVDSTYAEVSGSARIWSSLNGGGEEGHVIRNTHVVVKGGTIGTFGSTGNEGNVFGAGRGKHPTITGVASAAVSGNTQVDIQDGRILGSVFGGGNRGSVGVSFIQTEEYNIGDTITGTDHGYTLVNVSGGQIGHEDQNGRTGGNVYGGCRGVVVDPSITTIYQNMSHVKQTEVNIFESDTTDTFIMGSVFGGGEDGHVFKDTYVNVSDGQIGGSAYSSTPALCDDRYHGNVYGGGRGLDTYTNPTGTHYSTTAGKVYGNTNVFIEGGYITRNVYGGGNLSTVGIADETPVGGVYKTGLAKVTITGGTVGVSPDLTNVNGMVFGSAHGMAGEAYKDLAMVKNTEVVITGDAQIKGSVFGSGEDGHTRMRTNVLVGDATVNGISYTGNNLVIGTDGASGINGNVYGGGRGLDEDESHNLSSTAGIVGISTTTLINNGTVKGSVFGGGNMASVGYEHVLDTTATGEIIVANIPADFGKATVTVTGGATIGTDVIEIENGNVFGSGKGRMGTNYADLSYVNETEVLVNGNAKVYGSVFGGGEDGHVRAYTVTGQTEPLKVGNTHVTIDGDAVIGDESEQSSAMKGNVYGGGRGLDKDHTGNTSPTAGVVEGNTKVDILNGTIWRSVFGGGNQSVVKGQKVANVVNGTIHADVHGGSNAIPSNDVAWAHGGLKTVNIRGGHVKGNVYGCSHSSNDGEVEQSQANAEIWTSFVNINGGTIDGNVHGAGYQGLVNGSVCVNIGKDAILNAPNHTYNVNYNKPHTGNWDQTETVEPTASKLVIGGSVYGGSDYYSDETVPDWNHYDVTGYALVFIDGKDYNTTDGSTAINYMNIGGGLFGSGTYSESGALGRHILLKEYGTRNEEDSEMKSATRTLTTIQRVNNLVIDHANVNLSGLTDISNESNENNYGVMRVSDTLAVINAGSIVLGASDAYAHMDSIYSVQSLNLAGSTASIYDHNLNELKKHSWYWLGIQDEVNEATLYNISGTGTNAQPIGQLTSAQENVILYNDKSKLWVRYHDMKENDTEYKQYYGELLGFFRMRADAYDPYDLSESFAYARPKYSDYTAIPELDETGNLSDGGFLSYNTDLNFFFDDGNQYTKTKQHPYLHPYLLTHGRNDVQEYRYWVAERNAHRWYVDGTRGWGRDVLKSDDPDAGRYPNKPKKTLFGTVEDDENGVQNSGVVNEQYSLDKYVYETDIIYVVGALSAADEKEIVRGKGDGTNHKIPLKLFRYPGGHYMSNNKIDSGTGDYWVDENQAGYDKYWYPVTLNAGPGMNKGAMVDVQTDLTMKAVVLDGLSNFKPEDVALHDIPTATSEGLPDDCQLFDTTLVTEPLIITRSLSTLTLGDSTVLMRGYNHTNAADWGGNNHLDWYNEAFYDTAYLNLHNNKVDYIHETGFRHGGAIYVDGSVDKNGNDIGARVYVKDTVYITNNKQHLKIGNGDDEYIESNVFLPTFKKHIYAPGRLDENTRIGVTSPRGNADPTYETNTFSPVVEFIDNTHQTNIGTEDDPTMVFNSYLDAQAAWERCNLYDDQDWFFVNGHSNASESTKRTTYYDHGNYSGLPILYFGWTWANVVRKQPVGYAVSGNAISISSEQGLAWLISVVNGMNRQTASNLSETTVSLFTVQSGDIKDIYDMVQYVWVPVGNPGEKSFAGTFDGNGHLLTNLYVEYLGKGDKKYEFNDYGMFGNVGDAGKVDRTFLVSGEIRPVHTIEIGNTELTYNIGGLVGVLNGTVSNSEAAMRIVGTQKDNLSTVAGGLVGKMNAGEVHSSMAMPDITVGPSSTMAGLVGSSAAGNINNSFVHAKFTVDGNVKTNIKAGGLLGVNNGAKMENCYLATITPTNLTGIVYDSIVASNNSGTVDYSYVMTKYTGNGVGSHCGYYAPVITADELGYMYADNRVNTGSNTDTTLFVQLNRWVDNNNRAAHKYATWARPGLSEINGDLPVLLLSEYDKAKAHQGGFRSMGTYAGGPVLQYSGPVRDVNEVGTALTRFKADENEEDCLFIYGDVVSNISLPAGESITQGKVSIYEHAAILSAGDLADFENTYVGITFDNSKTHAMSTHGVNGLGMQDLPRDWHMMSSPLAEAPLGFNYLIPGKEEGTFVNTNEKTYVSGTDYNKDKFYNNPWKNTETEFTWLNGGNKGDKRYWMKDYAVADGYFPTLRGDLFSDPTDHTKPLASEIGHLFIENSDEHPGSDVFRYPYGMDFFTWYEPEYHWVNFKRNGPNHWHSDEPHQHLEYFGSDDNVNEETLIKGRGYMAAISIPTFLQSHGKLNKTSASIQLTQQGTYCTGWNLVGNPFHGYLDFDAFANNNGLGSGAFYVIYDADGYHGYPPESAFLYYPNQGSEGGAYAGKYLHPHQGFFLYAYNSNITFNEASIVKARESLGSDEHFDGHFRGEDLPRYPLVNLFLSSDNGCSDVTVVEFERPEWGGAIKLPELRVGDGLFYGYHEGNRYAALFAQEGTTRVPLWFEAKEDDIFTMKWKTANGDFTSLYLIDNLKGIEYDMLANDTYTFEGHKQDYYSRFYIVFNVNDVEEHHEYNIAFFDGSQWVVTGEGELDFIDLQGRILWHGKLSGGQTRVNFPVVAKGMYLLRLVNPDETKVQKIIVK